MSGARDNCLRRLRASLATADVRQRTTDVESWLRQARPGPLPALAAHPTETFCARAEASAAQLRRVATAVDLIAALQEILGATDKQRSLVVAPDERLRALPWPADLPVEHRHAGRDDRLCLSVAEAGIAETGSLVLLSGTQTPSGLNFLPDHFVCLLAADRVLAYPEDLWAELRARPGGLPRAVHLITGPSRTADVEQTMQLGAHGPRHLTILMSEAPASHQQAVRCTRG